jgi:hypothetical protein
MNFVTCVAFAGLPNFGNLFPARNPGRVRFGTVFGDPE